MAHYFFSKKAKLFSMAIFAFWILASIKASSAQTSVTLSRSLPVDSKEPIAEDQMTATFQKIKKTWRASARKNDLSINITTQTEKLIDNISKSPSSNMVLSSDRIKRIEEAIDRFVATNQFRFKDDLDGQGLSYWLSLCIANSITKKSSAKDKEEKIDPGYEQLIQSIRTMIRVNFEKDLSSLQKQELKSELERGLNAFESRCRQRVATYRKDVLCPAFKKPLDDKTKERIISVLNQARLNPKMGMGGLLTKAEARESYLRDFRTSIQAASSLLLYNIFKETLEINRSQNPYWGFMHFKSVSENAERLRDPYAWPAYIRVWPEP